MTIRNYTRSMLLAAFLALSISGFLIHDRVHPISGDSSFILPFAAGILNIAVLPALFWFRKTLS
ncbi:MAG TPA: hypothetical protein VLS90_10220 [Thermodesulfobacteriota bacterium]|nr:hypothetical protein [Thermodesulfobacteriota bacterium]